MRVLLKFSVDVVGRERGHRCVALRCVSLTVDGGIEGEKMNRCVFVCGFC